MSEESSGTIIIKRKKVVAGEGHHGGAWKVAYADFVTAMMAFFLLMWLLNATTEEQRKGLADYFKPSIPIHRTSGGGDGPMAGDSIFAELKMAQNGTGATRENPSSEDKARGLTGSSEEKEDTPELVEIQDLLEANSGESEMADDLLQHIRTRVTDEGLVIELFERPDNPLWVGDTATATPKLNLMLDTIAEVIGTVENQVAVRGHLRSTPLQSGNYDGWDLSTDRSLDARTRLARAGLEPQQFQQVGGKSDRVPVWEDAFDIRNTRIEIILLRDNSDKN